MEKRKIALDLDGVLADLMPKLNDFYNCIYKPLCSPNFGIEDYRYYDLEKIWKCTKQQSVQIVKRFYRDVLFDDIQPIEGSREAVDILSRDNDLVVITARPDFIGKETKKWIEKYYPRAVKEVICTGEHELLEAKQSKSNICLERGIGIIIEDSLGTVLKCSEAGIVAYLYEQPWNKNGSNHENIIRVKTWKEILEKIS